MGVIGIGVFLLIAYLLSENRRSIRVTLIIRALFLQISFGALMFSWESGRSAIISLAQMIEQIVSYGDTGITYMLESYLSSEASSLGSSFALTILPKLIFFSSLISVLYHIGIMGILTRLIGRALKVLLKLSDAESLVATSNLFLGHIESTLMVKPYVSSMSRSQLFLLLTIGMSTISVGVMGSFSAIGISIEYLITASIMAIPGSVVFARIIQPAFSANGVIQQPTDLNIEHHENIFHAAASGARFGIKLALNIGATLLAFVGLIALLNGILTTSGNLIGIESFTLESLLGFLLSPLTFLIGVPWEETHIAGITLGKKLILNEFLAFLELARYQLTPAGQLLSERTLAIVTISLCGFGSLSAIAVLTAGIRQLADNKKHQVASMGVKALLASSLTNLTSAAIVGLLI